MSTQQQLHRLNWGCGTEPQPGWINSDIKEDPTVDISCDILEGLPLEEDSIDYVVSIHALPELRYPDQAPGGVLRLALPDLDRAIEAYRSGDRDYFLVPDEDAEALGSKLIVQMLWYGYSKTLFTFDFVAELLGRAGFDQVRRCEFQQTHSPYPEIVSLDNRREESLFVEARK
jgi:predicted SAM-dependent methyltransferase